MFYVMSNYFLTPNALQIRQSKRVLHTPTSNYVSKQANTTTKCNLPVGFFLSIVRQQYAMLLCSLHCQCQTNINVSLKESVVALLNQPLQHGPVAIVTNLLNIHTINKAIDVLCTSITCYAKK